LAKVVAIGGGSSYTPELVEGLIKRQDKFPVQELWLVDVEPGKEKLDVIAGLARRMVEKARVDIKVHATLDRRKALRDADFVITQLRVGQIAARVQDESIPARHGLIGQETNGAGGLFKGLRTIPVIFSIIEDCKELCPQAWIINFANPAGMITEAVFRYTDWRKFIGLCNVPINMERSIAQLLGVDPQRVRMDFAGLNHMVFGLDVYLDGVSIMTEVLAKLGQGQSMTMQNIQDIPWTPGFLKGLEAIPCPYLRYYFQKDEMLAHTLEEHQQGRTRGQQVRAIEKDLFTQYADPSLAEKPPQLEQRGGAYYSDAACNLMTSIYTDAGDVQVVNTINDGAISDLPQDVVVEISCVIGREGPRPLTMGHLPLACRGIVQEMKAYELLACRAAVSGEYEHALVAMAVNPLVQSEKKAAVVLEEMLLAHREHLPQFQDAIRGVSQRHEINS